MFRNYNPEIIPLRGKVARRVREAMADREELVGRFVEEHYPEFGLSKSSFTGYMTCVRSGKKTGCTTGVSKGFKFSTIEVDRLSKLLRILDIPEDEVSLEEIREKYTN